MDIVVLEKEYVQQTISGFLVLQYIVNVFTAFVKFGCMIDHRHKRTCTFVFFVLRPVQSVSRVFMGHAECWKLCYRICAHMTTLRNAKMIQDSPRHVCFILPIFKDPVSPFTGKERKTDNCPIMPRDLFVQTSSLKASSHCCFWAGKCIPPLSSLVGIKHLCMFEYWWE